MSDSSALHIDWVKYCNYAVVAHVYRALQSSVKHVPTKPWAVAVSEFDAMQNELKQHFRGKLTSPAYACVISPSVTIDEATGRVRRPRTKAAVFFSAAESQTIIAARSVLRYNPSQNICGKMHGTKESLLYATYAVHKEATLVDAIKFSSLF